MAYTLAEFAEGVADFTRADELSKQQAIDLIKTYQALAGHALKERSAGLGPYPYDDYDVCPATGGVCTNDPVEHCQDYGCAKETTGI